MTSQEDPYLATAFPFEVLPLPLKREAQRHMKAARTLRLTVLPARRVWGLASAGGGWLGFEGCDAFVVQNQQDRFLESARKVIIQLFFWGG